MPGLKFQMKEACKWPIVLQVHDTQHNLQIPSDPTQPQPCALEFALKDGVKETAYSSYGPAGPPGALSSPERLSPLMDSNASLIASSAGSLLGTCNLTNAAEQFAGYLLTKPASTTDMPELSGQATTVPLKQRGSDTAKTIEVGTADISGTLSLSTAARSAH